MRDTVTLGGVVLLSQQVGDYDRRLVVLTRERGRITVFAHGARRPRSPLIAVTNPFVFANFTLYEGRDAYSLARAEAVEYFSELSMKIPEAWYGIYFLELASYYGREGLEAESMVNLIYTALRALSRGLMPPELVRRVYELRILKENGEFAVPPEKEFTDPAVFAAVRFTAESPFSRLFSFSLEEEPGKAFAEFVRARMERAVDKSFKSLAVIEKMR